MTNISDLLPDVYQTFLPAFIKQTLASEHYANCSNCSMVDDNNKKEGASKISFLSNRKCCTYYPNLPNYLAGGLLLDQSPGFAEGKQRILKTIKDRQGVHPLGIYQPRRYTMLYQNQKGGFGNSEALLCPWFHKEQGHCTIWKYREMVCSTYYCKYVNGQNGRQFWNGLKHYLSHVQETLIRYVLHQTGFDVQELINNINQSRPLDARELDGIGYTREEHERLWGQWAGREIEFYKEAYALVSQLKRDKFVALAGIEETIRLNELQRWHDKCVQVPTNLKVNIDYKPEEETVKVWLKEADMSFELPQQAFTYIDNSNNWQQALKELEEQEGIALEHGLVHSLFHHNVLSKQE